MDRDLLLKIIQEKLKKNGNNNLVAQENPNDSSDAKKNNTEVKVEIPKNVPNVPLSEVKVEIPKNVPLSNLNTGTSYYREKSKTGTFQYYREKLETGTNGTKSSISPETSVENISEDNVEIKDNMIIIKNKDGRKFEIYYGYVGTIEDSTRLKDLKIPLLQQYELAAKKKEETLSLIATIDFYQTNDNKLLYYIRNKKEIVEKLYNFRADRHFSKKLINNALDSWLERIKPEIQWKEVMEVVKNYKEWEEINNDPLQFFLDRSTEVVGNEKLKIAELLSIVSSQLKKLFGIYRVHLVLTGSSGVGKSSTIKSILKFFYDMSDGVEDWIVMSVTRMTKESLGYLDVDSLDNKVVFIEQLDNAEGVNYLREAMSEGKITTMLPVKDENGNIRTVQKVIPGQPSFVTTNVTANVDHQIMNRSIQLYLSPAEDEKLKQKIIEAILDREEISDEELTRLKLITYAWLKSRPKAPKLPAEIKKELINLLGRFINFRNINRATEITRNLVRASASLFGRDRISKEDVDFIMRYFKKDIILTTLELSERDLQLLTWLKDRGFIQREKDEETHDITTSEIAQVIKMSTQETKKILDSLHDKGLLWKAYDGKKFSWALSHYGLRVLSELEREVEENTQGDEEVMIEDQLLSIIVSKLMMKDKVSEEELRSIIQRVTQASDLEVQDMLIKILEKKNIIMNNGDGTWKVQ